MHLNAYAAEPFVITDIRVEGLQRTEPGTVFNYLPMQVGDVMSDEKAAQAIKSLYATGFFKDVRIENEGDVLVVTVQERPSVTQIDFSGNKSFQTDKIKDGLKQIGIAEGQIFDKSQLDRAEQEIKRQYLSQGKYSAEVKATASPLERNRVAIRFEITEGPAAKIRDINIVGNHLFKTEDLRANFLLTTPNWMSWWNKDDQYSKQKLTADLEALRSFYMNQGYLEFSIDSTQVSISPDKRDVYITVNLTEGEKYNISKTKLAGDLLLPEEDLRKLINIQDGEVFSRQKVTDASKNMNEKLGEEGYAFANVNAVPEINKLEHTVAFTFFVDPGRKVYVRRINVQGNTRTRDAVVRREMRQLESAWYAGDKIKRSKERIQRLNFFDSVELETPSVPGINDQVDMNVTVAEKATGSVQFGAGLSSSDGVVLGFNVNQPNFLGTGNRVALQVNTSSFNTVYSLSYTDPYFTPDGISRGFDIYRRDVDTSRRNSTTLNVGSYNSQSYGVGMRFGMPMSEMDFISAGVTLDFTDVELSSSSPIQYLRFCGNNSGCSSNSIVTNLGWTYDSRDNILFPRRGVLQRLSGDLSLPGLDLQYYKISYQHSWYKDLGKDFTLMLNGEAGYADSYGGKKYPFFKNFYAGGVNSVRGFLNSSLGPRDINPSSGADFAVGGTKRFVGNVELFMPVPFVSQSNQFRLSAFVDGGGVYGENDSINSEYLRFSTGVGVTWVSPFGPLKLVLAKPLNDKNYDDTQVLQFQFGQQF
ncbi:outer membrane protein assembly factor BamA [Methylophilus medardicus]|uniref:Outer membrane protein assembly factor BamA n=1 Tax=Methylophilus medardicus TaxID=2588534 RepID=A0A5B8CXL6_9PROT|nr:outer membrane protein assembly factor BamA [Methylophilus medardicus]QDC45325.1 outer membrane protein assembly factor BamA [Methylophilus medardicus]QDC50332.1 outer membrane protein assembly factor BamA [Methylophilus medardicus]QDC54037.1 outer membrane protein assembly factor BamA [Methylophilus medardicus]